MSNTKPVSSLKYQKDHEGYPEFSRVSIPDSGHQGEEAMAINGMPARSTYDVFRHEFKRGMDPELYWLDKYKNDDDDTKMPQLNTDIRSLYAHEDVRPEAIINKMYEIKEEKNNEPNFFEDLFADYEPESDELERLAGYYKHEDNWRNRLILGDSLLVMNSLLNREGMKGQVQCVYFDPPYGIKYASNWQLQINKRDVKDNDTNVSGEPEMIKAYRDTWELGIHSYLSYLRDRLIMARELLTESGSIFVQISDENLHLVRSILDEVFGSENFFSLITFKKTSPLGSTGLAGISDYLIWYAKDIERVKYRQLYEYKSVGVGSMYKYVLLPDGTTRTMTTEEQISPSLLPKGSRIFRLDKLTSSGYTESCFYDFEFNGKIIKAKKKSWATNKTGMMNLIKKGRVIAEGQNPSFIRFHDDFPMQELNNLWDDTAGAKDIEYVVQTSTKVIQRCLLMTTDPGDLVLDPTCGGGTTAFVAEQWGRRWITIDTSRIALNIAKKRLISAIYPYYETHDKSDVPNMHLGFTYKRVPHITIKTLAQDLEPEEEVLYDQPIENKKRVRVTGPFTVEALQSLNVSSPETLSKEGEGEEEYRQFVERIFNNLKSNGIRNGRKEQHVVFQNTEHLDEPYLNARGWYKDEKGENVCVFFMIGPKFGTVSRLAVTEAVKAFRRHLEESSWLVILGFSFEDSIESGERKDVNFGTFQVTKVRMSYHIEIKGMDMYDPVKDVVKARNAEDIAYWEIDDDYTDSIFKVRGIHFSGGTNKEFASWRKGLDTVAKDLAKRKAEKTLRMQFDEDLWDRLYTLKSEPIEYHKGRKIAVRVISQFGEEATRILEMK